MTSPWSGPRHRSWASDTVIFAVVFLVVLIVTVTVDATNGPAPAPAYLTGLLGAAGAALFGAAGSDKSKREAEIAADAAVARMMASDTNDTAVRAEAKADKLAQFARTEHPENKQLDEPPMTAAAEPKDGESL
jgi:hypothetical protein